MNIPVALFRVENYRAVNRRLSFEAVPYQIVKFNHLNVIKLSMMNYFFVHAYWIFVLLAFV